MTIVQFHFCIVIPISNHSPLAGRDLDVVGSVLWGYISTHTPLAGRDAMFSAAIYAGCISTHTPLAGRDTEL